MSQPGRPFDPAESAGAAPPGPVRATADVPGTADAPGTPDSVATADSAGSPAIAPEAAGRIERLVAEYLDSVVSLAVGSPEYNRVIAAIDQIGERDFVATSAMSGRLLDRRFGAMRGLLGAGEPLARQLTDLRKTAASLDPARIKLTGRRSPREELEEVDRYFDHFSRSQPRLEALLGSLTEGRLALEQDNAAIATEQTSLATEMETLRQYAFLAGRMDAELAVRIDALAGVDPDRANALRLDVLPVVRRRRQAILTQLAVVMQGYAALRIVEVNNAEVIRAVAAAVSTTAAALRTAVMVASAAASQRSVLEQLEAARLAASTMSDHAAALEAGVSGPGGRVEMLRQAWGEVYAALDRVDAQKAEVLRTISEADRELTRAKPRSR